MGSGVSVAVQPTTNDPAHKGHGMFRNSDRVVGDMHLINRTDSWDDDSDEEKQRNAFTKAIVATSIPSPVQATSLIMKNRKGKRKSDQLASSTPKQAQEFSMSSLRGWQAIFFDICRNAFLDFDVDRTGFLTASDLWKAISKRCSELSLTLPIVNQLKTHFGMHDEDPVAYNDFIPILYQTIYQNSQGESKNDWFMITNAGSDGSPVYVHKETGEMRRDAPEGVQDSSQMAMVTFDFVTLSDGTELTTYMSEQGLVKLVVIHDGYEDEWRPFPEEWQEHVVNCTPNPSRDIAQDPRFGEFEHPLQGHMYLYLMESTWNTYLYMDKATGEWHRIPLQWERSIPTVKRHLEELQRLFPEWTSVNEQLLVLHECNYDLNEAIAFADINWNFTGRADLTQYSPAQLLRSDSILSSAKKGLRLSKKRRSIHGSIPAAAAHRIDELEAIVRQQCKQLAELQSHRAADEDVAVRQLVREKTKVQNEAARRQREAVEAMRDLDDIQIECERWRAYASELEEKMIKHEADTELIKSLKQEVQLLRSGKEQQALRMKDAEIESLRMENVALKMKLKRSRDQGTQPVNYDGNSTILGRLHHKIQQLKRNQTEASHEIQEGMESLNRMFQMTVTQSRRLHSDISLRLEAMRAKYLKEQMERKLLYNKVQELRGNIRVFLRVRQDKRGKSVFQFPDEGECTVQRLDGSTSRFEYDQCYGPETTQERVFNDTKPVIMSCVDGYNVCIMAYGQTGSGKTYTMMGTTANPGVNRRAVRELLELCKSREEVNHTITVSLMEVYNEKLFDLLTPTRGQSLSIHASPQGVYVGGLTEMEVTTQTQIEKIMALGDKNRSMAATKMNTDSSRSHLLLQLRVTGFNTISKTTTIELGPATKQISGIAGMRPRKQPPIIVERDFHFRKR
eukprot:gene5052-8759_t